MEYTAVTVPTFDVVTGEVETAAVGVVVGTKGVVVAVDGTVV